VLAARRGRRSHPRIPQPQPRAPMRVPSPHRRAHAGTHACAHDQLKQPTRNARAHKEKALARRGAREVRGQMRPGSSTRRRRVARGRWTHASPTPHGRTRDNDAPVAVLLAAVHGVDVHSPRAPRQGGLHGAVAVAYAEAELVGVRRVARDGGGAVRLGGAHVAADGAALMVLCWEKEEERI
jgi:hypothetical protein